MRKLIVQIFTLTLLLTSLSSVMGQVLDPNDPIVVYNSNNPPAKPPWNQVGKWVVTPRLNWDASSYKAYYYNAMAFRLKFPKTYQHGVNDGKKYPLVIMLHGVGERGNIYDNEWSMRHGGQEQRNAVDNGTLDAFIMYPQSQNGFWGNNQFAALSQLMDYFANNVKVDLDRVVVHGLSSGGQAVWEWISQPQYARKIAAAIPMSAASPIYTENSDLNSYIHLPLWLSQGGKDRNPTPFTAEQLIDKIRNRGGNIRYTFYESRGHNTWYSMYRESDFFPFINRAHKTNPHVFFGKTVFCQGETIDVKLGFSSGFSNYEWRKDGILISGANSHEITVTEPGIYDGRFRRNGEWSQWSENPVEIIVSDGTPPVTITADGSTALPTLDGKNTVTLSAPDGYEAYEWSNGATTQSITVNSAGSYSVSVTEQGGCPGDFSDPIVVTVGNDNAFAGPTGFTAAVVSPTELALLWNDIAVEESYEVYRSTQQNSGYSLVTILSKDTENYNDTDLSTNTLYYYKLRGVNDSGSSNVSNVSETTQADTEAPTVPQDLRITGSTSTSISLTWDASTDFVGVTEYEVFQNDTYLASTVNTSFVADDLTPVSLYDYKVRAKDLAGNASGFSNSVTGESIETGLTYKYYHGNWRSLPDFNSLPVEASGSVLNVDISVRTRNDQFGFLFEGYIDIPVTGNYTFETRSDDGSKLYINPNTGVSAYDEAYLVVNNDGLHGSRYREGTIYLTEGSHPFAATFFERGGGQRMEVYWKNTAHGVGGRQRIPDSAFRNSTPNIAPTITATDSVSIKDNETVTLSVSAQVVNPGDVLTLAMNGLPGFATFIDQGGGNGELSLNPSIADIGTYENIEIVARDNQGGRSTKPFRIIITNGSITSVYINFNDQMNEGSPWNNMDSRANAGTTLSNLVNDAGANTGISVKLLDKWGDGNANELGMNTGNNSGVVPDNVMRTAYWEGSTNNRRIEVSGLTSTDKYNFIFFASRNGGGNRTTNYTINGETVSLNASYNSQNTVQINGVSADVTGKVLIQAKKAGGASYAYINALIIQAYEDDGLPLAPSNMFANPDSKTQISLNWADNSSDEIGFELWRAQSSNSNYQLLADLNPDVTSYTDNGLIANTTYYYKVRAKNDNGTSEYSNVAKASTFQYTVSLNFNRYNAQASPWNNTSIIPQTGDSFNNLRDDSGVNRGINVTITDNFDGENPYGMNTGNNSGVVPDNVMRSSYWLDAGNTAQLRVSGLSLSKGYNFVFFASRNGGGNRTTIYKIGTQSVSLNASYNTSQTVQINNVTADALGEIYIDIDLDDNASFGYLGALIIQAYDVDQGNARIANVKKKPGLVEENIENQLTFEEEFAVFPNPFERGVIIRGITDEVLSISMHSITGALLYENTRPNLKGNGMEIDFTSQRLQPGTYFLKVKTKNDLKVVRILKK